MKPASRFILSTSPPAETGGKAHGMAALRCRRRLPCRGIRYRPAGKELDTETGLYYFGARYLDPKTARWISGDPAVSDYIPSAPVSDEARERNGSLPGMGGVFNHVNLHVYHYAGNNPVRYIDPDGRTPFIVSFNDGDENAILTDINEKSYLQFRADFVSEGSFSDEDGNEYNYKIYELVPTGEKNNNGSRHYSRELLKTYDSEMKDIIIRTPRNRLEALSVFLNFGGARTFLAEDESTVGIIYSPGITGSFNNGRRNIRATSAEILIHEVVTEAIPIASGNYTIKSSLGRENRIRRELGLTVRRPDSNHTR